MDQIGGEDLDPDEAEDERDRLVEIAEAAYEKLDENEQGAEPEERERVRGPDHDRVAGDRESGGNRIDREGNVGDDDRDDHEQQWCASDGLLRGRTAGGRGSRP